MKALVCEMCSSQDLVKQDGLYVCQSCGTKYTAEDAKKLLVEVSGSVKIDTKDLVANHLTNARTARSMGDWAGVEQNYNFVLQHLPSNTEALFYSAYAKARNAMIEHSLPQREAAFKVLGNSIKLIEQQFDFSDDQRTLLLQIADDILGLMGSNFTINVRKNIYGTITYSDRGETILLFHILGEQYSISVENIIKRYPLEKRQKTIELYAAGLKIDEVCNNDDLPSRVLRMMRYHQGWKAVDPNHSISSDFEMKYQKVQQRRAKAQKSGCYVATAVYGSYDCPQVWTLRRFRDNTLAETWYGRAFIRMYYAVSPPLVKWFGKTEWFKNLWKPMLDRMVQRLNDSGVESTSYNDRAW